jgi:hypothetical protein
MTQDITRCSGQECPLQESCLRCTGKTYGRQDFFTQAPYDFTRAQCDYYWDDRPSEEAVRQLAYQLWQNSGCLHNNDLQYWLQARRQLIDKIRSGG